MNAAPLRESAAPQLWLQAVEAALRARPGTRDAGNGELVIACLERKHDDTHPSASWSISKGTGTCHGCGATWSCRQAAELLGLALPPIGANGSAAARSWQIRDRAGRLIATHNRIDLPDGSKRLWWTGPRGEPKLGRPATSLPLYNAHKIRGYDRSRPLVVCEGEPAADALLAVGVQAVATVTGAAGCPSAEVLADLSSFQVALWADNDAQGAEHMAKVGSGLLAVAASVATLPQPSGAGPKHDAADYVRKARESGQGAEQIRKRIEIGIAKLAVPFEAAPNRPAAAPNDRRPSAWTLAQSAPDFLADEDTSADYEVENILARGSITELFSPRGLGKSHIAHAYAVRLARAGKRVLLIDRDNSRREVKRRLRAWGGGETPTLKVLTRERTEFYTQPSPPQHLQTHDKIS